MRTDKEELKDLIIGMRKAYANGKNAMAWARANSSKVNSIVSTLIAYDLQAGTYVENAINNPNYVDAWCHQLANLLNPYITTGDSILEVGVGEATTLAGVMCAMASTDIQAYGFDLSWSRISFAQKWTKNKSIPSRLFVGDLFNIPLADNAIDIVYTSHSLEPNGGKEKEAIKELIRIARKAVVIVEPCFELASKMAQDRMLEHGYVRGLRPIAESLGVNIAEHRILDICNNPLNPSGVLTILKPNLSNISNPKSTEIWQCPLTGAPLSDRGDYFYAESVGIAYPTLDGVPLLRGEHAVIASKLD